MKAASKTQERNDIGMIEGIKFKKAYRQLIAWVSQLAAGCRGLAQIRPQVFGPLLLGATSVAIMSGRQCRRLAGGYLCHLRFTLSELNGLFRLHRVQLYVPELQEITGAVPHNIWDIPRRDCSRRRRISDGKYISLQSQPYNGIHDMKFGFGPCSGFVQHHREQFYQDLLDSHMIVVAH